MRHELAKRDSLKACAVLLAGGRGTRFWPRSRMRTPKQLLNITGRETMLRQTAARLRPLFGTRDFWVVTNAGQVACVRRELPAVPGTQILAEPVGRNTAAAIGLAAIHLERTYGDAVMAVLPADSYVADVLSYQKLVADALQLAREQGTFVVLGIPPTRPETGYGYIEAGEGVEQLSGAQAYSVARFTEKPELELAREYVAARKYLWNAGMFFWRVSTFLAALKRFLPDTHAALAELSKTIGIKKYSAELRRIYPRLQNISVDYAVMEPSTRQDSTSGETRVLVIPAEVGWSDIGSWAAVYELLAAKPGDNVSAGPSFTLDASGNYLWSPKKFVAALGVQDMVVVETDDAVLVCPRERSQDVGKIVKWLEENKKAKLL
jgi:mannose-1-phosphate guanylyltransferase